MFIFCLFPCCSSVIIHTEARAYTNTFTQLHRCHISQTPCGLKWRRWMWMHSIHRLVYSSLYCSTNWCRIQNLLSGWVCFWTYFIELWSNGIYIRFLICLTQGPKTDKLTERACWHPLIAKAEYQKCRRQKSVRWSMCISDDTEFFCPFISGVSNMPPPTIIMKSAK